VRVFADSVFVLERGGKNGFSSEEGVVVVVVVFAGERDRGRTDGQASRREERK
jgi:hypothetical protein